MKRVEIDSVNSKVTREFISKIGHKIYQDSGVDGILIKVSFKDGSAIGFRKDEFEDDFEGLFEEGVKE